VVRVVVVRAVRVARIPKAIRVDQERVPQASWVATVRCPTSLKCSRCRR